MTGLGLFQRRRRTSMTPSPDATTMTLRVLVDSGPSARELLDVTLSSSDSVSDLREAIATQIGQASISLFKVAIPWQAHHDASAYAERYGTWPSLLSVFPGYNMDDASQVFAATGTAPIPYTNGNGSLRSKRNKWQGLAPSVAEWFPSGGDAASIDVLARTASSSSSLDWARPASNPLTLSAYLPSSGRHYIDISPDATVAELKVQLLLAAGLPAPAGQLDAISLSRVDMRLTDLVRGKPADPRRRPVLHLRDPNSRVGDYFSFTPSADPSRVDIAARISPSAFTALQPRSQPPTFTYPLPMELLLAPLSSSSSTSRRSMVSRLPPLDTGYWPSPNLDDSEYADSLTDTSSVSGFGRSTLKCCAHEGAATGLIGLGITMSPPPRSSSSDNACLSSDDEGVSWPTTPRFGCSDDSDAWGMSVSSAFAPAWSNVAKGKALPSTPRHLHNMFIPPTPIV